MITTKNKTSFQDNRIEEKKSTFSPSVNIIRDSDVILNYIPTPNSKRAFNQIINDYQIGIKSFNLVGAYGTGKSSFLWAFEKSINQKNRNFGHNHVAFSELIEFEYVPIVGDFLSLTQIFANRFGVTGKDFTVNEIIQQFDKYYESLHKSSKGLLIVIDEFGKFLEYASKNHPESELFFIQQLAEYINDRRKHIILITVLHQDFNGYAHGLTKAQQNEWDKVKGRLKEITFNEPVEQLLFLASEKLSEFGIGIKGKTFSLLFKTIELAKVFPLRDYFTESYAEKLLPFDILSAAILTLSLQKYGQNERSLFSFIEANDYMGIKDFDLHKAPYYNLSCIYDYLIHNYYSFLTTKYNPHYVQWAAIRTAIERAEGLFENNLYDAIKLIKSIGLLNIFASGSARIDKRFLTHYGKYSLGITEPGRCIKKLEELKIIRFVRHKSKYILFEGTDLDIELAIDKAGNLVERVTNVVHFVNQYFDIPYIQAKAVYYEKGTPRIFVFNLSETPEKLYPEKEIDGYINLIFSDDMEEDGIKQASKECEEAVLYGWYKNTNEIKNLIFEIEKIKKVRENHSEDKVALRELNEILQHQTKLLEHYVIENIYSENSSIVWYYHGKKERIDGRKSFNRLLTNICNNIYSKTPIYRNEMVNKTKLSPPISTARRNFLKAMTEHWNEKDLGFEENKFPPEKTIYLSLVHETGMHYASEDGLVLRAPTEISFLPLWQVCLEFLQSTRQGKRNLRELVNLLLAKPFKLKHGFIDFLLPIFLFWNRDDFALYFDGNYIPFITDENLELLCKNPENYEIKAFDIEGLRLDIFNRYRSMLNQSMENKPTAKSFIETIRPFLTFYKQLPEYAKITKRLNKKTLALRESIVQAKDPEEAFFEHFPNALGFNIIQLQKSQNELELYITSLQNSIREMRTCYDDLLNRVETFLLDEIIGEKLAFPDYKVVLQNRFRKLKKHLLLPSQKVFHHRIMSELDDRRSWISSVSQACIGKSLEAICDEDESILYDKLKDVVHEMDNLCELSKADVNEEKEDIFKLEITSFVEGIKKNLIRMPKNRGKEIIQMEKQIKAMLGKDKSINVTVLSKLLSDLLNNDK